MTLLEIEAFLAVVKYGNISAAADQLFVSQPALSRRIRTLESELGYPLFKRSQGHRQAQLTENGTEFYELAWKWQRLMSETEAIKTGNSGQHLRIAAIDSMNHNILVPVYQQLILEGFHLLLYHAFSEDVFAQMEKGMFDLAFFTQQDYTQPQPKDVIVRPLYSEAFGIATMKEMENYHGTISKDQLKEENEIFLPWNKEFRIWHNEIFDASVRPLLSLEHAILAQYYLAGDAWTFAPITSCLRYEEMGCHIYSMEQMPPHMPISCAYFSGRKEKEITHILAVLKTELKKIPGNNINYYSL